MTLMTMLVSAATAMTAAAALPSPAPARAIMRPRVSLELGGPSGAYHLEGVFAVAAPASAAWDVVTDYEGLSRFVRCIAASRVVSRGPRAVVLQQEGVGRFLFVRRRVSVTLDVAETPPSRVDFRQIRGPFAVYEGSWRIMPSEAGCLVAYELTAKPGPGLGPAFAAKAVLRRNAQELLEQVRVEILRRAAAGGGR